MTPTTYTPECIDPTHAPCPDGCGGEIVVGRTYPIIDRYDLDGDTGELVPHRTHLAVHIPEYNAHWWFDPASMVATNCDHGVAEHPLGVPLPERGHVGVPKGWVRSKYARSARAHPDSTWGSPGCVVCMGEPRPDDLTTPRSLG